MVGVWPWRTSRTSVGGGGVVARAMIGSQPIVGRPWHPIAGRGPAAGRGGGRARAGPARGWWPGGSRSRRRSGPPSGTRSTGAGRCPGFGDPDARVVIVGLAPAAHGANRTGRMFTGDRSGDFLYAALHRTGFANQPTSTARDDGLALTGRVDHRAGALRAAGQQADARRARHLPPVPRARARAARRRGCSCRSARSATRACARILGVRPRPRFAHGVEVPLPDGRWILGSYHVSQQNTFTGTLTEPMLDAVLRVRAGRPRGSTRRGSAEQGEELAGGVEDRGEAEEAGDGDAEAAVGGADREGGAEAGAGDDAEDERDATTRQSTWSSSDVGDRCRARRRRRRTRARWRWPPSPPCGRAARRPAP